MKMIVGLGNIGPQYKQTRHNTGFMTVDQFAEKNDLTFTTRKMEAKLAEGFLNGEKLLLVKPTTFMNESGRAVGPLMDYYDLDLDDLIVVYDDMDLPLSKIRLRQKGSAGGHNGIRSLIAHLGTDKFNRIRVGVDHPSKSSVVDYVLGKFTKDQAPLFEQGMDEAVTALEEWTAGKSFSDLMNQFN
ncbi:peptidyl-tRNA hydrolase [Secundilactobacillus oryzae JCM 18671]|uniref:Peptidyl-tRNA hydrolase n=1 Tax=Secundilactobacillus oryzae JCM 18671 TaxID=1291743 RepID=A0A081BH24_9LACO|nr:aminoacyl-tRNA hydrolase [Secundilactobacillus oryzae]GAK47342.1 peptidyl-tRNA hydrolase [Secundilactobacillus oryzae JCM 18671]